MDRENPATVARAAAALGTVVALGGIALAAGLADSFSPLVDDLSDLGVAAPAVAAAFNGGLVLGGGLAAPLVRPLWRRAGGVAGRVAAVAFGVAAVAMAGVGAFPAGTAPHFPAALVFFLAVTVVLATDGVARRGTRGGAVALALAVAHVALWAAWLVAGTSGLAVPETGGALALAAWTLAVGPAPAAPAVGDLLRARA